MHRVSTHAGTTSGRFWQVVSPRIYPASYPAWFFSRPRLPANLPPGWKIDVEFDAIDRQLLDGVRLVFKGLALRRTC